MKRFLMIILVSILLFGCEDTVSDKYISDDSISFNYCDDGVNSIDNYSFKNSLGMTFKKKGVKSSFDS